MHGMTDHIKLFPLQQMVYHTKLVYVKWYDGTRAPTLAPLPRGSLTLDLSPSCAKLSTQFCWSHVFSMNGDSQNIINLFQTQSLNPETLIKLCPQLVYLINIHTDRLTVMIT